MDKQKRNTKSKQMVMSVFNDAFSALCHEDIEKQLAGKIDRVTIYRILNGFCDDGKLHKIVADNGKTYFALCHRCSEDHHNDNHLHFKCLDCGKITCIDKPVETPRLPAGYSFSSMLFTVYGHCPCCVTSEK
ncbi:MAG: transcriptional repressor [Dysgonamonadaceae bacterium]|jgi:Fe2+ or Zn2+ uptake regulation protein|nr:transcriptional repressor [Dysgonamonadaceae bacterium]